MFSRKYIVVLGVALSAFATETTFAKQSGTIDKTTQEAEKAAKKATQEADKAAKEAAKLAEKAAKDAAKSASSTRIELIAKMKAAEVAEDVDAPENEAYLKYRSRDSIHKLTVEVEGFNDGDIMRMYIVVNGAEVLVSELELISDGVIPRQQIEFDDSTWPTGVPTELTEGMIARLRDSSGQLVLEAPLAPK